MTKRNTGMRSRTRLELYRRLLLIPIGVFIGLVIKAILGEPPAHTDANILELGPYDDVRAKVSNQAEIDALEPVQRPLLDEVKTKQKRN